MESALLLRATRRGTARPIRGSRQDGLFLLALVALGIALRGWLTIQWGPGFVGYSDSGIYFQGAYESVWADPIRTVGYSVFLDFVRTFSGSLDAAILAQHTLGIAVAILFFATLRLGGAPVWVSLACAGVLLVGGTQLMIEHAALSEGIYIPLLFFSLFACLKTWKEGSLMWAVLLGVSAGLGITTKGAAVALVPVFALCLLLPGSAKLKPRLIPAGVALLAAGAVVFGYVDARRSHTGERGLTSNSAWNLYGRVAPWADCGEFDPPQGSEVLCEDLPREARGFKSGEWYIYDPSSPAQRYAGPPFRVSEVPGAMETLSQFSRAAIVGQPGAYADAVWRDVVRLVSPDHPPYSQLSPTGLRNYMLYGLRDGSPTGNSFVESWRVLLYPGDKARRGAIGPFVWWDRLTTPRGPLMALALLLALAAPFVVPARARFLAVLMSATAFAVIFFPIVSKGYDFRFVIPAIGPLTAAALLGVWGLLGRWKARRGAGAEAKPPGVR